MPALYNLAKQQLLSREFAVVGISHGDMSTEDFRRSVTDDIKHYAGNNADLDVIEWFVRRVYYVTAEFDDKNAYASFKDFLAKVDKDHSTHGNFLFYLATAPRFFGAIVEQSRRSRADARGRTALAAGYCREAFRARPRISQGTEPAIAEGCEREADLSH